MRRMLIAFWAVSALGWVWSPQAQAAACDEARLNVVVKTLPFIEHEKLQPAAAQALFDACPELSPPLRTLLFGRLTVTHEKFAAFVHLLFLSEEAKAVLKDACPDHPDALAPGRFSKSVERYLQIFKACGFDRLNFASTDELRAVARDDVSDPAFLVLAPVVFHGLLVRHVNEGLAREVTRALVGLSSPIPPDTDKTCDGDGLRNTAGALGAAAPDFVGRFAAQGMAESCPTLPKPVLDVLRGVAAPLEDSQIREVVEAALTSPEGKAFLHSA